eukprot:SAG11_NODE_29967_length_305_cov_1.004854_1_plen_43_part_10
MELVFTDAQRTQVVHTYSYAAAGENVLNHDRCDVSETAFVRQE